MFEPELPEEYLSPGRLAAGERIHRRAVALLPGMSGGGSQGAYRRTAWISRQESARSSGANAAGVAADFA